MQHVRRRIRFERRVPALPPRAEAVDDPIEVARRARILQMRREQPESALEDFRWSSRAGSRQKCRSNSTLRRPTRMQELRLRPVDPAFEQASREAAADAGGPLHRPSIQPEEPAREIGGTERSEESGRMKPEPMKLPRRD